MAGAQGESRFVVDRLNAALNAHDLEAFLACFHEDYGSDQPAHPERAFQGREQVRTNWAAVFEGVPDFRQNSCALPSMARSSGASGGGAEHNRMGRRLTWSVS